MRFRGLSSKRLRFWGRDERGTSAVEFAFVAPVLILMFVGGFAITQAIAVNRKITITTRALADLTSQFTSMSASDMSMVMNAAKQILAPFDSSTLGIRITEVMTDSSGQNASVQWSAGTGPNITCYEKNKPFNLPAGIRGVPNVYFIYAETFYPYKPAVTGNVVGQISMGDNLYMLPRKSQDVPYSGSGTCQPSS